MLLGKCNNLFVEFACGATACWHVGVVCPHQLHTAQVHRFQLLKVGLPTVALQEVVVHNLLTENLAQRSIGRITRDGHQHFVARVTEGKCYVQDALLAADERLDFRGRVKCDTIPALIEIRHRLTQFGDAYCWLVAVCIWTVCVLTQHVNCFCAGWHVWRTNGQRNDVLSFCIQLSHFLEFAAEVVLTHERQAFCRLYLTLFVFHLYILLKS